MSAIRIRPLGPGDRDGRAQTFAALSARSRLQRFLGPKPRPTSRELTYTLVDDVPARALLQRLGFRVRSASGGVMELELDLAATSIDARAA
jgi:hypothetical protein